MAAEMSFDLILVHAPSIYDFRERDDVLFSYLNTSATVHVSSIFEMPPVGILAIKQYLENRAWKVEFFNVASRMLKDPEFDVEDFFRKVPADYVGFDLHWLVHSHGSLELARVYKEIHPEAKTLFGGIAATYFHEELIGYPQVDYVVRGFDTLMPIESLIKARNVPDALEKVPNLTWKSGGEPKINLMSYVPDEYHATVDWGRIFSPGRKNLTLYNEVIPQAGCEYNCRWCGGSGNFYRRYMGVKRGVVQKTPRMLRSELDSILDSTSGRHSIVMMDHWHQYETLLSQGLEVFSDKRIGAVHYCLAALPDLETVKRFGKKAILELSPDSHDIEVARASGRGHYTMEEMERFLDGLIDHVYAVEVYFMIGLPLQTPESVWKTLDYCEHLLKKYQGKRVIPYISPMVPFLDPGSDIFENPQEYGYRIFHKTLEEHRRAMISLKWRDRLNYETVWLDRQSLVDISYEVIRTLYLLKNKYGQLPDGLAQKGIELIDSAVGLLDQVDRWERIPDGPSKTIVGEDLRRRILKYNREQLKTVRSQQRPVDFGFSSSRQWFDTDDAFDRILEK